MNDSSIAIWFSSAALLISLISAVSAICSALEARKTRQNSEGQLKVMREAHDVDVRNRETASLPIFVPASAIMTQNYEEWNIANLGGLITNLSVETDSAVVEKRISPSYLEPNKTCKVYFSYAKPGEFSELKFTIRYMTVQGKAGSKGFISQNKALRLID